MLARGPPQNEIDDTDLLIAADFEVVTAFCRQASSSSELHAA